jgi:hypothetical protein
MLLLFCCKSSKQDFPLIFLRPAGRLDVFYLVEEIAAFVNLKCQGFLTHLEYLAIKRNGLGRKVNSEIPSQ